MDVTSRVVVGAPVEKSPLQWSVPYNVVDAAGNQAATVWRDVVVEEVDIGNLEDKVRREVMAEKEKEIQEAVQKAIANERAARGDKSTKSRSSTDCPVCAKCKQCSGQVFDASKECSKYCEEKYPGTCDNTMSSNNTDFWAQFDGNNPLVNLMSFGCLMIFLRFIVTLWFNPGALVGLTNYDDVVEPVSVTVPSRPNTPSGAGLQTTTRNGNPSFSDPLIYSDGNSRFQRQKTVQGGLFSPPSSRLQQYSPHPDNDNNDSYYNNSHHHHTPLSSSLSSTPSYRTNSNDRNYDPDRIDIYADIISPSETGDYHSRRR